ncbi:hypothetical protein CYMTET_19861 [Cymbomonas tetramitiformis]|uniref:Uncharacterized protein n=1 Tax=Cymbomonas tetramitiformis TaxID=36881 RepID=A0AAE0L4T4_9CHLO|nr:hypothetical protein CYMTET_19861 [Cymbomonas tetramitiformis]
MQCPGHNGLSYSRKDWQRHFRHRTKTDGNLAAMGGALADAAGVTRARKAVHFEPQAEEVAVVDDEGVNKRKKSKSKKKKRRHSSSSDSSSDTTDSDSSADRKARQRRKRKQGAELTRAAKSMSAGSGGVRGGGGGSTGDSPDPKNAALRAMLSAQEAVLTAQREQARLEAEAHAAALHTAAASGAAVLPAVTTPTVRTGIPPPPSVTAKKVSVIEAKEMSRLFRLKPNWEALRLELVKFQVVDPRAAMEMTKTEILLAATEAHNGGFLDLRNL